MRERRELEEKVKQMLLVKFRLEQELEGELRKESIADSQLSPPPWKQAYLDGAVCRPWGRVVSPWFSARRTVRQPGAQKVLHIRFLLQMKVLRKCGDVINRGIWNGSCLLALHLPSPSKQGVTSSYEANNLPGEKICFLAAWCTFYVSTSRAA